MVTPGEPVDVRERTRITPQEAWIPRSAAGISKRPHDTRISGTAQTHKDGARGNVEKTSSLHQSICTRSGGCCSVLTPRQTNTPNPRKRIRRCACLPQPRPRKQLGTPRHSPSFPGFGQANKCSITLC